MKQRILDTITGPADLKALTYDQLAELAVELRGEMIAVCAMNGGHLASSLGAVELILAAHRALDCPADKIVFDVGHQAYAHKLITGRLDRFHTLRKKDGLSGFPKIEESPYDAHDSGHASDALSTALGYALARDLSGGNETVLAVIGDASISGGLCFEALNTAGQMRTKLIVLLNDNEMSISRNVGALSLYLGRMRTSRAYMASRDAVESKLSSRGAVGETLTQMGEAAKRSVKHLVVPGMLFEEFGFTYIGPIDGHSIFDVENAIEGAKHVDGPVIIHCSTRKGAGYEHAEAHPELFHGIGPFDIDTGKPLPSSSTAPKYTTVFADALAREAARDPDIVAITAAMASGTGLDRFASMFPRRYFDVGIAEENAVTMAGGMALAGKKPVVAIYSTFLQRAFDEIVTNVCLPNQHVVFALDRAGLVGADGPTHHGVFDLAYLRMMPNMKVIAPSDEAELACAVATAVRMEGPVAVRYPRGNGTGAAIADDPELFEMGTPGRVFEPDELGCPEGGAVDVEVLVAGRILAEALDAARILAAQGLRVRVTDMRWVKPLPIEPVARAAQAPLVVTVEEGVAAGGFGSAVLEELSRLDATPHTVVLGIPDAFVGQGSMPELLEDCGLSATAIAQRVAEALASGAGA